MQTTPSVLVPPHTVRHTNLSPPDVQVLAPVCLHFPFVPRSSISGDLPLCAALSAGQRQETVVSHCRGALFMENSRPPRHHVVFPKIWDSFLFLLILLLCSLFILSQTCIQLSSSRRGFRGAGWEVSRRRGGLIEVSSIYLPARASHKAQTVAKRMETIVLKSRHDHAEQQATGGHQEHRTRIVKKKKCQTKNQSCECLSNR